MKFYSFALLEEVKTLHENNYSGALFTYNIEHGDYFTRIANTIDKEIDFKYMVAIRPYTISPQYLCMINNSMNTISKNRIQINLISGIVQEYEKDFGGVIGTTNDLSSNAEKSEYLIDYINTIKQIKRKVPDYYVTITNEFVFNKACTLGIKMIIPYEDYKNNLYNLDNQKVMIAIAPIIRETKEELENKNFVSTLKNMGFFTYEDFNIFIEELKDKGIDEVMICLWNKKEKKIVNKIIKEYKEKENKPKIKDN
jgi:hypothetical protein